VDADGPWADDQDVSDLGIGAPSDQQRKHFQLAGAEAQPGRPVRQPGACQWKPGRGREPVNRGLQRASTQSGGSGARVEQEPPGLLPSGT
jgi:hypothetical protein